MTTKLKIDLTQGILEVEGSEVFVKAIYNDFKAHFTGEDTSEALTQPKKRRRTRKTQKTNKQSQQSPETVPAPAEKSTSDGTKPVEAEPEPQLPVSDPVVVETKPIIKSEYNFLEKLDLSSSNGRPSLIEFMDAKFPITNEERNMVFLYYLQYSLKVKQITIDHIYTCYRGAKIRAPLNIEHSLQATADQRHWVKIAKNGHLSLTPSGKLYVEKQLPKTTKS